MNLQVVPLEPKWIPEAAALQRACFPPPFPAELLWQETHLLHHLDIFPEGQFVAVKEGRLVGSASSMLISNESWQTPHTWDELTGGLFLYGHQREGEILYGVDISVHPEQRGIGVARLLYQARFEVVRSRGLLGFATICRLPDFSGSQVPTVEAYLQFVVSGKLVDRTLTPLLKLGLCCTGTAIDCMEDEESGNSGARLEWRP